jgi:hypothetical protein
MCSKARSTPPRRQTVPKWTGRIVFIAMSSPDALRNLSNVPARMFGVFGPTGIDGFFDTMVGQPLDALSDIAQRFGIEIIGPMIEPLDS